MTIAATSNHGGTGSSGSSSSLVHEVFPSCAAGREMFVMIGCDNLAAGNGNTTTVSSVTDQHGHTYSKVREYTNGNGGAGEGATISLWMAHTTTELASWDDITVTFSTAVTNRVMRAFSTTVGSGNALSVASSVDDDFDATTDIGSASLSGLTSKEYLFLRVVAREWGGGNFLFPTTSGYNDLDLTKTGSTDATGMSVTGESRVLTDTGSTSNPTLYSDTNSADIASMFLALEEITAPVSIAVPSSSLTITEYAADFVVPVIISPGPSAVAVSTYAPSLFVDEGSRTLVPSVVVIAISSATPSTGVGPVFTPDAGSVVVAAGDPVIAKTDHKLIAVDVVVVAVSGAPPFVGVAEQTIISPDHVSVLISTNVANAVQNELLSPSSAALLCTSYAVALQRLFSSTPDTETLVIAGFAPGLLESVSTIAQPGQCSEQVSCTAPVVSIGVVSQPGAYGIAVSGHHPSLTTYRVASPASAGLSVTGNTTGLSQGVVCSPGSYAMSVSGIDPTQLASVRIEVGKTTVVIEPETAGIIEHHLPSGGADGLVVVLYVPVVLADSHEIEVGVAALTAIGVAPAVEEGATLVIVGEQPSIGDGLAQCFSAEARLVPAMSCEDVVYERGWE